MGDTAEEPNKATKATQFKKPLCAGLQELTLEFTVNGHLKIVLLRYVG
jgi:hypothetical protein